MDFIGSELQIGAIALCIGILIGILGYRFLGGSTRQTEKIADELKAAKTELTDYKDSVNQHFHKTSDLVNELTQNYVKVYQHLAEGAQSLGNSESFNNLLEHQKGRVAISLEDSNQPSHDIPHRPVDVVEEKKASHDEPTEKAPETVGEAAPIEAEENVAAEAAVKTDEPAIASATDETADSKSSATPPSDAESPETVLNVDALGGSTEKETFDGKLETVTKKSGNEEATEVRPTTH